MTDHAVDVEEAVTVTDELLAVWQTLLPQVSRSASALTRSTLQEIVDSPATVLFMARCDGRYVGSLTLVLLRIPDGVRGWIEDVVVDESARGRGIGRLLNEAAIERARSAGVRSLDLTSSPERRSANRLYERLGFQLRSTNVYRYHG